ncbi:uncharacterized protein [Dermacentor andersoni]|uniref:uncharacterized protein isoform X1 n=1 Tax=Dermacentor andersoni TaxID=34620 RepID=UPI003B3A935C
MLAEEAHASANLEALRAALSRFCASFFSSKTCSYMNLCQLYMMNYDRKRRVARKCCPCEVGDYSRTCPTVGRVGAREGMTVIRKQYRASSCRHRRSRGRKRKATLEKLSSLDEGRNYSPSTTPAPHRQPVKSIVLKQEHSPCRRCFEDAAKPTGYDDMKATFPCEATSEPPRGRHYVDTVSATVVDFPEPPSNSDLPDNSVLVDALFKELFWVLKLHGLPFSGSRPGEQSSVGGIKKRRRLLLERAAAFACPTVCAAYAVHCTASLYLALKRDQDTMMAVVPDVSDLCRALVSFLTAVHGALNGARVSSLLRHSAAAMFGGQPSTSDHFAKPSNWSSMRRIVIASSGFALLSWLVFVGLRISTLRRRGPREYCVSYLYGFVPSGGDGGPAVYVVPVLDALLYGAIVAVPRWSIALHVSLCLFLGAMAEQLSTSVKLAAEPQGRYLAAAEVRELRLRHASLCRAIGRCDDLYNWLLFIWCGDTVLCFIFGVPWIMARADVDEPAAYTAASIDVTLAVVLLVALLVAASEPGRLAKDSLTPHVLRLACCDQHAGVSASRTQAEEVALNQELLMLSTAVRGARVEMSGWNCFDAHRGSTITAMSMLATYAVLVYQMLHHIE